LNIPLSIILEALKIPLRLHYIRGFEDSTPSPLY
jgi:hypothetical protein